MLSHAELMTLEQRLRNEMVLSIYVNGDIADVAARSQWRTELRNALDAVEESLRGASHADREAFAEARQLAMTAVDSYKSGEAAPGWMGLFSANEVHQAAVAPVAVPTTATWALGANLAPAIRMLKESRPALVVVADSSRVRIHRYADRAIALVDSIEREAKLDQPYHMGQPAPQGFSSGTRGRTGTDAAQRELRKATDLMLADAAQRIDQLAGDESWILIGGIDTVAAALQGRLEKRLADRSAVSSIDIHDNEPRLAEIARHEVSRLRAAEDLKRVEEVLSANKAGGVGAVGLKDIDRALFNRQVHELYVTTTFVTEHADEAESAIRRAFDESATVEHVAGDAAERLDAAGGIAARLRFTLAPTSSTEAAPAR